MHQYDNDSLYIQINQSKPSIEEIRDLTTREGYDFETSVRRQYNMELDSILTIKEASRILNVNINTLRKWGDRGIVHPLRVGLRRERKYLRSDIATLFLRYTEHYLVDDDISNKLNN